MHFGLSNLGVIQIFILGLEEVFFEELVRKVVGI